MSATKHIFSGGAVVFQFTVRNTVPEVLMERVSVAMAPSDPTGWRHVVTIAAPKVGAGGLAGGREEGSAWGRHGFLDPRAESRRV